MRKTDFPIKERFLSILRNSFITDVYKTAFSFNRRSVVQPLSFSEGPGIDFPDNAGKIHEIMKAVHRMDYNLKTPYSMFLGGYRYEEISDRLNIPIDTVKERILSARRELQTILTLQEYQKN